VVPLVGVIEIELWRPEGPQPVVSSLAATRVRASTLEPVYALRIESSVPFVHVSKVTVPPVKVAS
jgi:hypothetical protein